MFQSQQEEDNARAALIEVNCAFVDKAILVLRSAVANQLSWTQIQVGVGVFRCCRFAFFVAYFP